MSRETVVWTTSNPFSFSADATSAWVESARSRTSSRMAFCLSRRFIVCRTLAKYAVQDRQCLADLVRGHGQRRRETHDVVSGGEDEQTLARARLDDLARAAVDLDTDQEPATAHRHDTREGSAAPSRARRTARADALREARRRSRRRPHRQPRTTPDCRRTSSRDHRVTNASAASSATSSAADREGRSRDPWRA